MSVNIKFGNNTLEGVSTIRVQDADSEGQYDLFTVAPENTWTVTFMDGENEYSIQSIVKGTAISNSPGYPKTENYKSIGWCTDTTDENTIVSFPYTPTDNTTLYAYYVEKEQLKTPNNVAVDGNYITCDSIPQATEYEIYNYNDPSNPVLLGSLVPITTFTLNIKGDGLIIGDDSPVRMPTAYDVSDQRGVPIFVESKTTNDWVTGQYGNVTINTETPLSAPSSEYSLPVVYELDNAYPTIIPLNYEKTRGMILPQFYGETDVYTNLKFTIGSSHEKPKIPINKMNDAIYVNGCVIDEQNGIISQGTSSDGIFYIPLQKYLDYPNLYKVIITLTEDLSSVFKIATCLNTPGIGDSLITYADIHSALEENQHYLDITLSDLFEEGQANYLCLQICNSTDISNDIMKEYVSFWVGQLDDFYNTSVVSNSLKIVAESSNSIYGEVGPSEDIDIYVKINGSPKNNNDYSYIIKNNGSGTPEVFNKQGVSQSSEYTINNVVYLTCWTDSPYNEYIDYTHYDGSESSPFTPIFTGYKKSSCIRMVNTQNEWVRFYSWINPN